MIAMRWWLAFLLMGFASVASGQVQTQAEAIADDAIQYAAQFGVTPDEAAARLKSQQANVSATNAIAREFAARLAGIAIEHAPEYRIIVLLKGGEPVADRSAEGVRIVFRTGAKATHAEAVAAMRKHLIDLRNDLPNSRGAGYDQRTGEVVLLVTSADAQRYGVDRIHARAERGKAASVFTSPSMSFANPTSASMAADESKGSAGSPGGAAFARPPSWSPMARRTP